MDAKGLSHVYPCIHSSPDSPPIQAATEHWAEFLGLYSSRSLLVIHFKYSGVYTCYFSQVKKTLTISWPWRLRSAGNLTMEGLPSPFPGPVLHWLSWKWKWMKLLSCVQLFATPPTDYSLPGSSVHGIFQARILGWVAISFPRLIILTSCKSGSWKVKVADFQKVSDSLQPHGL